MSTTSTSAPVAFPIPEGYKVHGNISKKIVLVELPDGKYKAFDTSTGKEYDASVDVKKAKRTFDERFLPFYFYVDSLDKNMGIRNALIDLLKTKEAQSLYDKLVETGFGASTGKDVLTKALYKGIFGYEDPAKNMLTESDIQELYEESKKKLETLFQEEDPDMAGLQ